MPSPHAKTRKVVVDGKEIPEVETLTVMGLIFRVGASSDLTASPLALARAKFWKLKHLFQNHTPLKERVRLFDRIITPTGVVVRLGTNTGQDRPATG